MTKYSNNFSIARLAFIVGASMLVASLSIAQEAARPNVLLIMADDLGYGDLSCYGGNDIQTPHLDQLMSEGMRFNEFYANCCVCSPTRAALLSGRYPELVGIPGVVRTYDRENWGFLTPESVMLPQLFRENGYHTTLIGKWHLGLRYANRPNQRGFDEFHGWLGDMMDDYWKHRRHNINYMRNNENVIDPKGHATDLFTQWSIASLQQCTQSQQPWFQFLAYNAPHAPIQPPTDWLAKVKDREKGITDKRAKIVALIEHLDDGIGKVLQSLEESGQQDNTIVFFTSDNGGRLHYGASNGLLRSDKTHLYEGGIKVPTCVKWTGRVKANQTTEFIALTMDLVPTLADICGVPIQHEIDGRSFKTLLLEGQQEKDDLPLFHGWLQNETKEAMRHGDWKLVRDKAGTPFELYNIKRDPYEKVDLAEQEPERLNKMTHAIRSHMNKTEIVPWKRPPREN